jgi:hypothetical protein
VEIGIGTCCSGKGGSANIVMYGGTHRDWNCFLRKIMDMVSQTWELREKFRAPPLTTDEIEALDHYNFGSLKKLQCKTRDQSLQEQALTDEWIVAINGQA